MTKRPSPWEHVSIPTLISGIISALMGILFLSVSTEFATFLGAIEKRFGFIGRLSFAILVGAVLFFILQIISYWRLARKRRTWRTITHYIKVAKTVSPLKWISCILLLIVFMSQLRLSYELRLLYESKLSCELGYTLDEAKELSKELVIAVFAISGTAVGLITWFGVGVWYRRWSIKKGKTVAEALLTTRTGLIEENNWSDKDGRILKVMNTLDKCHFIFLWSINFSKVFGGENPNALSDILRILERNPDVKIYILFYCPFCGEVIDRSIGLDHPYDDNYIAGSQKSISNWLVFKKNDKFANRIHIALTHGSPHMRSVLWGRLIKPDSFDIIDPANPKANGHTILVRESLLKTEWGGFLVQTYPPREHGSLAPLYQGGTVEHGGMWDNIRAKFTWEFSKGIMPDLGLWREHINKIPQDKRIGMLKNAKHLAHDLGMSKRKANKTNLNELVDFITSPESDFYKYVDVCHEWGKDKAEEFWSNQNA